MWNGKNKAVTFSYDDGVEQDIRLVEIFNIYGLKCTFNLNSGLMNDKGGWIAGDLQRINRMKPEGLPDLYKGHEIAVHCVTHANLLELDDEAVREEILGDKSALEKLFCCKINGMAYPYGAYDERVIKIARECGLRFCRTVNDTHGFELPKEHLAFGATCHHRDDQIWNLLDDFLNYDGEEPVLFCLWGHSYEFTLNNNWDLIEEFCRRISGHENIFYGTNSEVLLG